MEITLIIIQCQGNVTIFHQPTDGLLYDLNRDEATVLILIDDPKWINDYAVCKVIRTLKKRIDELNFELGELQREKRRRDVDFE
jgi:hypothetical protein